MIAIDELRTLLGPEIGICGCRTCVRSDTPPRHLDFLTGFELLKHLPLAAVTRISARVFRILKRVEASDFVP